MKLSYWMIALCLLAVTALALLGGTVRAQAQELLSDAQRFCQALDAQDGRAEALFGQLDARYAQSRSFWMTLLEHDALDEVEIALSDVGAALAAQDTASAYAAARRLQTRLSGIADQLRVSWYNLL